MWQKLKLQQIFHKNHEYSERVVNSMIFFTAATMMMMFANVAVVSVKAAAILTTTENAAAAAATLTRTLLYHNASRNPTITQQSLKTFPPQTTPPSLSSFPMLSSGGDIRSTSSPSVAGQTHKAEDILNNNSSNILATTQNMGTCKLLRGTWGDVDPNIFYLCDMHTNQPLSIRCPEGKGYFNGLGYSGCIPYAQWPGCVASSLHNQVPICDSDHMQQPWETVNPNKFYICLQETTQPMLLNCGPGKGFVHATASPAGGSETGGTTTNAGASEIVGCANWEKWRSYMKCRDYY